ncbi:cytochrome c1 [Nevskia sp.]|uniref:cytochrome c1 n=1 Tax=Nevskia sp. TaxID=1929292 RepID=UPI0025D2F52D|nr:cytochrome c1 [Nevskia sp.]
MKPLMNASLTRFARAAVVAAGVIVANLAAANSGGNLLPFAADSGNVASVQRGARNFMAYCSGCHGMKYLRYNRIGQDLNIPDDVLKKNLMFTSDKLGDQIKVAMPAASEQWFGRVPPDLSLETRARGADWVYSYLLSFYLDETRPLGVNNTVLAGASMPHVLWELQGWQKKAEHAAEGGHGGGHGGGSAFEQVTAGSLKPSEYEAFVTDIVNFMDYAAEPGKQARISLGLKVMLYLFGLLVLTYLLKKEFWRDVH